MAQTTGTSEDIIEKRESNPIATSCILIATLALVGAIVLQLYEVGQAESGLTERQQTQLHDGTYLKAVASTLTRAEEKVDEIVKEARIPGEDIEMYEQHAGRALSIPDDDAGDDDDDDAGDDDDDDAGDDDDDDAGDDDDDDAFGDDDDDDDDDDAGDDDDDAFGDDDDDDDAGDDDDAFGDDDDDDA